MKSHMLFAALASVSLLIAGCEPPPAQPVPQSMPQKSSAAPAADSPKGTVGSQTAAEKGVGHAGYAAEAYRLVQLG